MKWLLDPSHRDEIVARHSDLLAYRAAPVEDIAAALGCDVEAVVATRDEVSAGPRLKVVEGTARIDIRGPLLDSPYWLYDAFGVQYSDYQTIKALVAEAEASEAVSRIRLDVDSPGGMVRGVFAAADAIRGASKPVDAVVSGMAASAGYLLASQADTIAATDRADEFGSIGVALDSYVSPRLVSVASTDAPNKRPDLTTEQGRASVREHLDQIHALFVDAVVAGRGVEASTVNERFGRGGLLLAAKALEVGMIDEVAEATKSSACAPAAPGATVHAMDRDTLKREHPELFAALVQEGRDQEHKRVLKHLQMGEAVGDVTVAVAEIRNPESEAGMTIAYNLALVSREKQAERIEANPDEKSGTPPMTDDADLDAMYHDALVKLTEHPETLAV